MRKFELIRGTVRVRGLVKHCIHTIHTMSIDMVIENSELMLLKHTGHAQLQLDYHYKTADFKKSKGEKNSFEKSQDSRRVLVFSNNALVTNYYKSGKGERGESRD